MTVATIDATTIKERYQRDGYVFPLRATPREQALAYLAQLEAYEATVGGPIQSNLRHKVHLLFTWANELVRHPTILDAVEPVIGPNILCWTTSFFIKEAHDPGFVSWHQDSTYWGLEPPDVITAWFAFSDAPVQSGAMKFLQGSHTMGQIAHTDTFHEDNLLTRGQEVQVDVDDADGVDIPLEAGEFSLHHVRLVHGSKPNTTANRRIGLAIRYIPTTVHQHKVQDSAMLVRGRDDERHFLAEGDPETDMDAAAVAAHKAAVERQIGALYQGVDRTEMRS